MSNQSAIEFLARDRIAEMRRDAARPRFDDSVESDAPAAPRATAGSTAHRWAARLLVLGLHPRRG